MRNDRQLSELEHGLTQAIAITIPLSYCGPEMVSESLAFRTRSEVIAAAMPETVRDHITNLDAVAVPGSLSLCEHLKH